MRQEQFLDVIDRDEAERRFRAAFTPLPCPAVTVQLGHALGRVLAEDVFSTVDVPAFDRSNMDGYAVVAADTFGASEEAPVRLALNAETLRTGVAPTIEVRPGTATPIATGAIVPRGADAVVLVEATDEESTDAGPIVLSRRAVTPGQAVSFAGTDVARGELVATAGDRLTARETGVLAAIGRTEVSVVGRPRIAILSTGDEIVPPGTPMRSGLVYDSNARALADTVTEEGGEPVLLGIVPDDEAALRVALKGALEYDLVLMSGGTSKGPGDVAYRVLDDLPPPGVVVHGVALKPGKPLCLAVAGDVPVVVLPGFPTSALFTFHEFVAPVVRRLAGRRDDQRATHRARLAVRANSERGRTEYLLVNLLHGVPDATREVLPAAYPLGKGSGSVTTWSRADGFVVIDRNREQIAEGSDVEVVLLGRDLEPRDLVFVGSHCVGVDLLVSELRKRGLTAKTLSVGSEGGLLAAQRGECDAAGVHLFDPASGVYNAPFVDDTIELVAGYGRMQGVVYRTGDDRFEGKAADEAVREAAAAPDVVMVNRNRGSGTRVLIDGLLGDARPHGHANQAKTHHAVCASVADGRADFGVAIETVARDADLGFLPLVEERYDFAIPRARLQRPEVLALVETIRSDAFRRRLIERGFRLEVDGG